MSKHILITLDDAKYIADFLPDGGLKDRLLREQGADIVDIVDNLKSIGPCIAAVIEHQQHRCGWTKANKLGRRLGRLVERADNPNYVPHE